MKHNRRLAARVPEGYDIMEAISRGEDIDVLEKRTGLTRRQIFAKVTTFEELAPAAFRKLADGMRTFLANIAVDDVLHFRPGARAAGMTTIVTKNGDEVEVKDYESQKISLAAYKNATETIIKVFGLQSQSVDISTNARQTPHTMEEIAQHIRDNPEMAAAVDELNRMVAAKAIK